MFLDKDTRNILVLAGVGAATVAFHVGMVLYSKHKQNPDITGEITVKSKK